MTFFSVIIPTYNRIDKMFNTIEHLNKQSYLDFEVIVIEDVYNNEKAFSSHTNKINFTYKYLTTKTNVSVKRNIGANIAKGDYLIFLDDDDAVTQNWLLDFYNGLVNNKADIIFCAVESKKNDNTSKIISPHNPYNDERGWGIFLAGAFAVQKDIFNAAGKYDETLRYSENTELGIRLKEKIRSKEFLKNINLIYQASQNGGSKNLENIFIANNHIIAKHKDWFQKNTVIYFNYLSVLGVVSFKLKKTKLAQQYFDEALKLKLYKSKAWYRFIVSRFPFLANKIWHS